MSKDNLPDSFDQKILRILSAQGRISWRDLAEAIGLSLTPTLRRVRRLENAGYVVGYAAILNERRLAGTIEALVSIALNKQTEAEIASFESQIAKVKEVTDCFQITGESDYLVRVLARDMEHYQSVVGQLTRIRAVFRIHSTFVVKSVIRRAAHVAR
ncbi:MAG: Lrp/AsnC family transcriptional regulator [Steroidobacteraceae bacterium]